MARRKTSKEFEKEVYELVKDEYTFLEEYVTSKIKIKVKHNTCGHQWKVQPGEFLRGGRCPKCSMKFKRSGSKRKTHEQFTSEVYELVGHEYTFLDEYKNYMTSLRVKHHVCGETYSVIPSEFFQGRRCPNCSPFAKKTTKKFREEVSTLGEDRYELLSEYINDSEKVKIKHKVCGHIYGVQPTNFIQGQRCPHCRYEKVSKKTKKTQEKFEEEVYELSKNEYNVLSKYKGNHKKVLFKHNKCGYEYLTTADIFLRGSRCPRCFESKGERAISSYLNMEKYIFKSEYTFSDLKSELGNRLRFDFALLGKDGSVTALIEYDGKQHFEEVSFWGGEKAFLNLQLRDRLKDEYCKVRRIPLLRIPYTQFNNINNILERFLLEVGVFPCQV